MNVMGMDGFRAEREDTEYWYVKILGWYNTIEEVPEDQTPVGPLPNRKDVVVLDGVEYLRARKTH